jgi:RNA polymerase sigma factor (sigma-70 family)
MNAATAPNTQTRHRLDGAAGSCGARAVAGPAPGRGNLHEVVARAVQRDEQAWATIIKRFGPLVASVVRRYRLTHADAEEVTQVVWLKLFENLHMIREPAALPGWIVVTTQRQALRTLRGGNRVRCVESIESEGTPFPEERTSPDDQLLQAEMHRAVQDGLKELTAEQREFLLLVVADPPVPYREISRRLKIPIGSIGPTRARHLRKLSETTAIRCYSDSMAG